MKPQTTIASDPWAQWCALLALEAPTYGSQQRCLHLRPGWNKTQVQQMLLQTQAALRLLNGGDPFQPYAFLQDKNWLKEGAKNTKALSYLNGFLSLSEQLKRELPETKALWPVLKSEVAPTSDSAKAQHILQKHRSAIEQQLKVIDEIGVWWAKAKYGRQRKLQPSQISQQQRWNLQKVSIQGLSSALDFSLEKNVETVLLNGAHNSGKSAFLKGLYLLMMQHQSGVPCLQHSGSLPVYSGIHWLPSPQSLTERLRALKPLLHRQFSDCLIFIDDFLTFSAPGESHALAKAVLEHLHQKGSLTLLSTYDRMLMRSCENLKGMQTLHIQTQHKKTQLYWNQAVPAQLLPAARLAGLPAKVIQQAEVHLKALQTPQPSSSLSISDPKALTATARSKSPPPPPAKKKKANPPEEAWQPVPTNAPPGTRIYVPRLRQYGEIVASPDRRQRVQVRCEGVFLNLPLSELCLSSHRHEKKHPEPVPVYRVQGAAPEACDLHGLNVLDAIPVLEKYLDMAYHAGEKQLRVVHGKGTNTLRRAVHEHLEMLIINDRYAESYRLGYTGEGDSGVTIVTLK
jgi:dsDNA-specific endonuclease/ATPase MutS2